MDQEVVAALRRRVRAALERAEATVARSEMLSAARRAVRDPASMLTRCAWCGRLALGRHWATTEEVPRFVTDPAPEKATHGICLDCLARLEREGQSRSVARSRFRGGRRGEGDDVRALEPQERELLDWFLERETAWAEAAREALRDTEVEAACGCGCGTLQLTVDSDAALARLPQPLPLAGLAPGPDGGFVVVQLYVEPDRALLELVWMSEPPPAFELPRADELEIAPWSGASPLLA